MNLFQPFLLIREGVIFSLFKQTGRDRSIDAERIGGPDRRERKPDRFRPLDLEKLVPGFPHVWPKPGATGTERLEFAPHPFGGIIPGLIGVLGQEHLSKCKPTDQPFEAIIDGPRI